MKLLIVGSRSITNYEDLLRAILIFYSKFPKVKISEIVSGGAEGVDTLAKEYAVKYNIDYKEFLPDYDKYKKAAPIIRNSKMIEYISQFSDSMVLAVYDGISRGTENTILKAIAQKIKVVTFIPSNGHAYYNSEDGLEIIN